MVRRDNFIIIGTKIFNKEELDENNEIPAPFLLDENEFDALNKPELIPKPKTKSRKPPLHSQRRDFKRKEASCNIYSLTI